MSSAPIRGDFSGLARSSQRDHDALICRRLRATLRPYRMSAAMRGVRLPARQCLPRGRALPRRPRRRHPGPGGAGRVAFVSKHDVADVAARVLLNLAAHASATYSLTGPRAVSVRQLAELFTRTTGRPMTYHEETLEEAYASRAQFGAPAWQVDAWVSTYRQIAAGELDTVTDDIERLLGRPARSIEDYVRDHPQILTPSA
jgi:nucleoside-diphosphate-sugar epimerase